MDRIPVAGPWITDLEVKYAADAAANGWYSTAGVYIKRFEEAFAKYVGVKHAVSLPHCTAALHLSLLALGVKEGDEVIVPDATWIASAAPVSYVSATPVFADIDPVTWCIDPESVRKCITERTRAIIAVDLYGSMPDFNKLRAVAADYGLALIEDAAEGTGSMFHGRRAGSLGDTGTFSYHGSKTLTTGEGGMLVTDRTDIYERVMFLRDHGRPPGDRYFQNSEVAFKYKMSPLQAAVGLAQTERADELIECKRRIFRWYAQELAGFDALTLNAEPEGTLNSYWMVTAIIDRRCGMTGRDLMAKLDEQDIDSRPFFAPLSSLPAYRDCPSAAPAKKRNAVSYDICPRGINLPSAMKLTQAQVQQVCRVLHDVVRCG